MFPAIPPTVEEMKEKVRGVAKAVHEEEKGEAMVSDMESKLAALASKLSAVSPDKERVALGMSFRGILGKKGTLFSDVLRLAHVKDGAAVYEVPKGADAYLSLEILPKIDPDVILLPTWRVKAGDDEGLRGRTSVKSCTSRGEGGQREAARAFFGEVQVRHEPACRGRGGSGGAGGVSGSVCD